MALAVASTELEMVQDARQYLLANGGTTAELEINQRLIDKYSKEGPSPIAGGGFPMQRTGGPKKARQPDMAKPGQISYATDLLRRLWGHDKAVCAELTELLPTRTRQGISRQIDNLLSILASIPRPLNPELRVHLQDLWTRKMGKVDGSRNPAVDEAFTARLATMTYDEGRKLAARLQEMADGPAPAAPAPTTGEALAEVTEGLYATPNGLIFKVQVAHHGSGQLYAKQLVELEEPRLVRGKTATHGFVYVPGAIKRLRPEWKMSLEDAMAWGKLYGSCCRCGIILTEDSSIERGLGRICYGKLAA
jgi:hypothetical protein